MQVELFDFNSLRSDWYSSNQAVPRAIRQAALGKRSWKFVGFPRQWIPLFCWFRVTWSKTVSPPGYIPFFANLSEKQVLGEVEKAKSNGLLRNLVEVSAGFDSVIADCLFILDHKIGPKNELLEFEMDELRLGGKNLLLNSWHCYNRPSLLDLEKRVIESSIDEENVLILPCSMARPYDRSRTHRRMREVFAGEGYNIDEYLQVVISSIGIVPEQFWNDSAVVSYNSGVPDVYRTLRLARNFFSRFKFKRVVSVLSYEPYRDVLRICEKEQLIEQLVEIPVRSRQFHVSTVRRRSRG